MDHGEGHGSLFGLMIEWCIKSALVGTLSISLKYLYRVHAHHNTQYCEIYV